VKRNKEGAIMSNHPPPGPSNGPPSAGMSMQHQQGGQGAPPPAQNMTQQNLNQIVR
jgi:transcription initiation factor TFIID subunit 5